MNDKELLQAAARAAGMTIEWYIGGAYSKTENGPLEIWNPLRDPGDALRLAVALHIELKFQAPDYRPYWTVLASERGDGAVASETGSDTLAATMRAIVRAAADIERTNDVSDSSEKLSNLAMMAMGETVNHLKAEIEGLRFHDLRHTAITRMIEAGM